MKLFTLSLFVLAWTPAILSAPSQPDQITSDSANPAATKETGAHRAATRSPKGGHEARDVTTHFTRDGPYILVKDIIGTDNTAYSREGTRLSDPIRNTYYASTTADATCLVSSDTDAVNGNLDWALLTTGAFIPMGQCILIGSLNPCPTF